MTAMGRAVFPAPAYGYLGRLAGVNSRENAAWEKIHRKI